MGCCWLWSLGVAPFAALVVHAEDELALHLAVGGAGAGGASGLLNAHDVQIGEAGDSRQLLEVEEELVEAVEVAGDLDVQGLLHGEPGRSGPLALLEGGNLEPVLGGD